MKNQTDFEGYEFTSKITHPLLLSLLEEQPFIVFDEDGNDIAACLDLALVLENYFVPNSDEVIEAIASLFSADEAVYLDDETIMALSSFEDYFKNNPKPDMTAEEKEMYSDAKFLLEETNSRMSLTRKFPIRDMLNCYCIMWGNCLEMNFRDGKTLQQMAAKIIASRKHPESRTLMERAFAIIQKVCDASDSESIPPLASFSELDDKQTT